MQIAIIGASAGVGFKATQRALEQGHAVVTLSRRIDSLPDHPHLRSIQGSSTNLADVKAVVDGADAIVVALGTGTSTKATTLFTDSAQVLLQALEEDVNTAPLIVLTGFGASDSAAYLSGVVKLFFTLFFKGLYDNKSDMERLITARYDQREMVCPSHLTDGPMTGQYRVLDTLVKGMKVRRISRADIAHFLIAQAERPTSIGTYPVLTY